ncbi:unnamed protein product [Schistosoma curassoni]|uniref:Uncharacterized protein n=1 Tax=Schistosoma curassoni TaxID=6186 RepID=A0A183JPC0_9TREM|nr:unnamed protein product [Schistosoma curassoni]
MVKKNILDIMILVLIWLLVFIITINLMVIKHSILFKLKITKSQHGYRRLD